MKPKELDKRESIPGFDVEMIATRMQGWQLKPEGLSKDWRSIARETPDGRLLVLQMSPTFGYVNFWENDSQGLTTHSILCRNIKYVGVPLRDILSVPYSALIHFRGDVDYTIQFNGQLHEVRFHNSPSSETPIIRINYNFPE